MECEPTNRFGLVMTPPLLLFTVLKVPSMRETVYNMPGGHCCLHDKNTVVEEDLPPFSEAYEKSLLINE